MTIETQALLFFIALIINFDGKWANTYVVLFAAALLNLPLDYFGFHVETDAYVHAVVDIVTLVFIIACAGRHVIWQGSILVLAILSSIIFTLMADQNMTTEVHTALWGNAALLFTAMQLLGALYGVYGRILDSTQRYSLGDIKRAISNYSFHPHRKKIH